MYILKLIKRIIEKKNKNFKINEEIHINNLSFNLSEIYIFNFWVPNNITSKFY